MGNCLVLQENIVSVIKTDRKFLEDKPPIKVHQVLSDFSHHAISDELPPPIKMKKTVNFSDDVSEKGVVRIKLVIRKQDLQAMLSKGGVSVDQMISKVQNKDSKNKTVSYDRDDGVISKGWSPKLESIPEID